MIGGIEASLRRIAHYDYWSRQGPPLGARSTRKADLLVFGNAERAIVEIAHRLAAGDADRAIRDLRGTAFIARRRAPRAGPRSTRRRSMRPGRVDAEAGSVRDGGGAPGRAVRDRRGAPAAAAARPARGRARSIATRRSIRMPSFEQVRADPVLYAHASRILHLEANPGQRARAGAAPRQARDVWINPPPLPLTTPEMDALYELPFARAAAPAPPATQAPGVRDDQVLGRRSCAAASAAAASARSPSTRAASSRAAREESILREIERIRDQTPGFTGIITDLGGPTANMYRMACKSREIEAACRKPSCVFPDVCDNLGTDHAPLVAALPQGARDARASSGSSIASGVRYDLAVRSPE